ncbi:MAG: hypothetical protein JNG84_08550 [Archangium sp.]|nr:hypothetical protein [Archangium sp.]
MQQWFTQNSPTWFGIAGTGNEQSLLSAQRYIQGALLPLTEDGAVNRIRRNADLHLILLTDADDQAMQPVSDFSAVFRNYDGAMSEATVHGVVCPQGQTCGESQATPRRNLEAIAVSGGVLGDINIAQSGSPQLTATLDAIMTAVIARTGHQLHRPPIASTIKVAIEPAGTVGVCTTSDVPRSRASGYDFDAATRKMVFFGDCRPKTAGTKVAVSYRYWVDASPDPNGDPCRGQCAAPLVCQASSGSCVCAADCGGCTGGLICDPSICTCVPDVK